jgi:dipeptidase D
MQLFKGVGGDAQQIAFVAGWLPKDNKLADIYETFYKKVFKKEAKQVLINGGVEPAYVLAQRPEMLGISIGPLMHDVHSKNERLSIESTQKVYEVLTKFLPTVR